MEGFFFTCLCTKDQKVRCALDLLHLWAKDRWKLVVGAYSLAEKVAVTWDQFLEVFHIEYVPPVEREKLAQEYMSLKQTT